LGLDFLKGPNAEGTRGPNSRGSGSVREQRRNCRRKFFGGALSVYFGWRIVGFFYREK
jgi:hypothetical protein